MSVGQPPARPLHRGQPPARLLLLRYPPARVCELHRRTAWAMQRAAQAALGVGLRPPSSSPTRPT
eukprot:14975575-Alexandrium_andersonii.AAC.1